MWIGGTSLLAQATTDLSALSPWVTLATAGANIVFSVVVAWYLLSRAIPAMQDRFTHDLEQQRTDLMGVLSSQRNDFFQALDREQKVHEATNSERSKRDIETLQRVVDKLDRILAAVERKP